jgi:hypothetical protein
VLVARSSNDRRPLPAARGPLSRRVLDLLHGGPDRRDRAPVGDALGDDDLHLALYLCYELHYRGLPGVSDEAEWDPAILTLRRELESSFERGLVRAVPRRPARSDEIRRELGAIVAPSAQPALGAFVERDATWDQVREFLVHRSAYQLKEADPHSWVIPRLEGAAKTGVMEIQYDEYGSGDPAWMHAELFRATMIAAGLDATYGAYVGRLPGSTLATVNLISLFGLHRRWRGALVGHLAAFEMTSTIPNRCYGNGLRRLGAEATATRFFDEHVEADSVHEVLASDLATEVAVQEPLLAADILFGAEALALMEGRMSTSLLAAWRSGRSSLLADPKDAT